MSDSDKVVPPKKSKAARKTEVLDEAPATELSGLQEQNGHVDELGKASDEEGAVNIFKEQIVEGKRKRNAPLAEQTLKDWLEKNFVEKENSFLLPNDMYQSYIEACSSVATFALDYVHFHKTMTQMFPKGQTLVEDSPYKDAIREKKPKKKSAAKIQADSLHLKMKDIIKEAITDLGNPRKGIGFGAIKNFVAGKFPALRVDLRVNFLKNAIVREQRFGHIECVRGVGACGYYRLPRTPEQEAEELEAEKIEAKKKAMKKKEKKSLSSDDDKEDENAEKTADESEQQEKDKDKEKDKENDEPNEGDEAKKASSGAKEKPTKKKKKKTKKQKKAEKNYYVTHGEPQHIEDTFALAMTYNSEPKEASVAKIRKYIKDFYTEDVSIERLKKCLDTGVEHGFWYQVSGHGSGSGSFRLTINEFDPLADDDLTGRVMNAIVACTEPKQSSALLLKKYVQDYHPNFRVAERPYLFKLALQRALSKNRIIQLSGIGATGTFQLVDLFLPSPTVLQGQDTASDYAGSDVEVVENVEAFKDAYKPRPTKRRGMGRPSAASISRLDPSAALALKASGRTSKNVGARKPAAEKSRATRGRNVVSYKSSTDEESEEEEEQPKKARLPAKRKASSARSSAVKSKKPKLTKPTVKKAAKEVTPKKSPAARKLEIESESEEYDSEPEAYTPRKSAMRGNVNAKSSPSRTRQGGKSDVSAQKVPLVKSDKKSGKKPSQEKAETDEEEEEEEEEHEPKATALNKGKATAKRKKSKVNSKKGKAAKKTAKRVLEENEEKKTPKSGPQSSSRLSSAARMRAQPPSEDGDERKETPKLPRVKITVMSSTPSKSPGSGRKKATAKVTQVPVARLVMNTPDEESEEEEEEKEDRKMKVTKSKAAKTVKKKKAGKGGKSRK